MELLLLLPVLLLLRLLAQRSGRARRRGWRAQGQGPFPLVQLLQPRGEVACEWRGWRGRKGRPVKQLSCCPELVASFPSVSLGVHASTAGRAGQQGAGSRPSCCVDPAAASGRSGGGWIALRWATIAANLSRTDELCCSSFLGSRSVGWRGGSALPAGSRPSPSCLPDFLFPVWFFSYPHLGRNHGPCSGPQSGGLETDLNCGPSSGPQSLCLVPS